MKPWFMSIKPYSKNNSPSKHPPPLSCVIPSPQQKGWWFLTRRSTLSIPRLRKCGLSMPTDKMTTNNPNISQFFHGFLPPWFFWRSFFADVFFSIKKFGCQWYFSISGLDLFWVPKGIEGMHLDVWRHGAVSCQVVLAAKSAAEASAQIKGQHGDVKPKQIPCENMVHNAFIFWPCPFLWGLKKPNSGMIKALCSLSRQSAMMHPKKKHFWSYQLKSIPKAHEVHLSSHLIQVSLAPSPPEIPLETPTSRVDPTQLSRTPEVIWVYWPLVRSAAMDAGITQQQLQCCVFSKCENGIQLLDMVDISHQHGFTMVCNTHNFPVL